LSLHAARQFNEHWLPPAGLRRSVLSQQFDDGYVAFVNACVEVGAYAPGMLLDQHSKAAPDQLVGRRERQADTILWFQGTDSISDLT
jgi:hypothetical protein